MRCEICEEVLEPCLGDMLISGGLKPHRAEATLRTFWLEFGLDAEKGDAAS